LPPFDDRVVTETGATVVFQTGVSAVGIDVVKKDLCLPITLERLAPMNLLTASIEDCVSNFHRHLGDVRRCVLVSVRHIDRPGPVAEAEGERRADLARLPILVSP